MSSIYIGSNGIKTHTSGMNIVGNNIANSNTIAFKQQNYLFQELMYRDLTLGNSSGTVSNQLGLGSLAADIRPVFQEGPYESTMSYTDLAINGKGYFMVDSHDYDKTYLTRAGNFTFSKEGYLEDGNYSRLMGYPVDFNTGADNGPFGTININAFETLSPPDPTTKLTASFNLGFTSNSSNSYESVTVPAPTPENPDATKTESVIVNPYFSMLSNYDANLDNPMANSSYSQAMSIYDADGNKHSVTMHFDIATDSNGIKTMEFLVTMPPEDDTRAGMQLDGGSFADKAGLLMAGTLTYNSSGQLTNMSAFTATASGAGASDLANWKPAAIGADGLPSLNIPFSTGTQRIGLDLGVSFPNGWKDGNITAAGVGDNLALLPGVTAATNVTPSAMTTYSGSSVLSSYIQDGNAKGHITGVYFQQDGTVVGSFSNGQEHPLARIPIFRVTSEDGLKLEGGNYYSTTSASGLLEDGVAGTENYGSVLGSYIEASNVDMAVQMVNMISLQRGFQSNSKVVSTSDEMLQKAIELKR